MIDERSVRLHHHRWRFGRLHVGEPPERGRPHARATLTLSVSVALTVLVPLAVKGYVKRDEALPYIMGANITTLADTLVVAMLQHTPVAARIVLAEAIGVTIVSIFILAVIYGPVKRSVIGLDDWLVAKNVRLAGFVVVLFIIPIALLLSGLVYSTG